MPMPMLFVVAASSAPRRPSPTCSFIRRTSSSSSSASASASSSSSCQRRVLLACLSGSSSSSAGSSSSSSSGSSSSSSSASSPFPSWMEPPSSSDASLRGDVAQVKKSARVARALQNVSRSNSYEKNGSRSNSHEFTVAVSSSATLACTLTTPASSSSPQATAILIHGWRSSQNASIIQVLKNRLLRSDFAVLTYDARGCGASTGEQTYGGFSDEVKDLKRVVAHVETKLAKDAGVPPIKLLFGHSRGGNVALLYASRVGGIPAVVSAAARAQLNEGIRERLGDDGVAAIARGETLELPAGRNATTRVTPNDVAERLRINMNDELEMVCDTAFLLVAAHDDAVVPSDDAQRLKAMIPPRLSSDVVVVPGACHRFRDCESEVAEHVVAFVCSQFDLRDKIEGRSRDDAAPSVLGEWRKASMSK